MVIYLDTDQKLEVQFNISIKELLSSFEGGFDKNIVLANVNGEIVNLSHILKENDKVNFISIKESEGLTAYRNTLMHVFAHAVKEIYPTCILASGKVTETGFYYDVEFKTPIKNEDLQKISDEMKKIVKSDLPIETLSLSKKDALKLMRGFEERYKVEQINQSSEENFLFDKHGGFIDISAGVVFASTGRTKHFRVNKICGAYYKNDKNNKMLTRISVVAYDKRSQIDEYFNNLKESESNSHIKLGKKLGFYASSVSVGKALPIILNKGRYVIRKLTKTIENELEKQGYEFIETPIFAKPSFYKKSMQSDRVKDKLYSIETGKKDNEIFALRDSFYAFHYETYSLVPKSYKELPVKFYESGTIVKKLDSGALKGLVKLRQYTSFETTIFCSEKDVKGEVSKCIDSVMYFAKCLGLNDDISVVLGVRGNRENSKYIGSINEWLKDENALRDVLSKKAIKFSEKVGECSYYAPSINILLKNSFRKDDKIFSISLDTRLTKLYKLKYTNKDGKLLTPASIRVVLEGGYEKLLAYLIEKNKGEMPFWLSPTQISIISVNKNNVSKVNELNELFLNEGFKSVVDVRNITVSKKIRETQTQKIPYTVIVGENESQEYLTYRKYQVAKTKTIKVQDFISKLKEKLKNKE